MNPDLVDIISIGPDSCEDLPVEVCQAIRRYGLRYSAQRVSGGELARVDQFTKSDGAIVFKFWAADFQSVIGYSGNHNPLVHPVPKRNEIPCRNRHY